MNTLEISKYDDVYFHMIKSYYPEWGVSFEDLTIDELIENINAINNAYNRHLDVKLRNDAFICVYDSKSNERIADYEFTCDLGNSIMDYCWNRIKN